MTFSVEELERYARHVVLAEIGGAGQQKLKAARVLVIGAGGLGSPLLQYLAAAGIGTLGIVDDDVVALSNLQRQIIHDSERIGQAKTWSAAQSIVRINPHVQIIAHECRLDKKNAKTLIRDYGLVADGSDNFETRNLVAKICEKLKKPLVSAAVGRFDGMITTLKPYEKDKNGKPNPRYKDLFPEKPKAGTIPSCAEAGIVGALTGIVGSMQALEAIKQITGAGEVLVGRLLMIDALTMRLETINYARKK